MSNKTSSAKQSLMKASDVMTSRVVSVKADASIMTAIRLMLQNHISGLPVTGSDGELLGIVTEGDFLRRGEIGTQRRRSRWLEFLIGPGRWADEYVHARGRKVAEVMTPEVITITGDAPLDEAVMLMERHRIKRLPVVRDGRVVGIVSRANIMHALVSLAIGARSPVATTDASIRANILAECDKQPWRPLLNVVVRDHVVHLWGTLTDERERQALVVLAENVPGVQAVHDHMVWVEPTSGFAIESLEDEELERKAAIQTPALRSESV
jgi:CBS domain-containing protein